MSDIKSSSELTGTVLPTIEYTEFKLANGLRVLLHEDHSTPIVAVNLWYHVGSKNEVPGRTGFAHLFEHLMFQGSKNYDDDYFKPLQEAGGMLNGSTNPDRTNYWEVVPSNFLALALFLEADRMGGLLDAMTEEKLANQRDVVKNEKRQNYDNQPYGSVREKIAGTMYPPDHPYHWLTIGSLEDLTAASLEDVKDFFRRFYTPNNASLAIAGDFHTDEARALVEKYFGPIKRGPEVPPVRAPRPGLAGQVRLDMEDRVTLPRVYMVWHAAAQYTPDDALLDALANLLAGSKSSRLYKALVYERQIAQDVTAFNNSGEIAGLFQIVATARPDRTLAELERAIDEEVAKIKSAPPSEEETERAYNVVEASFIYSLRTVGGFGGKSNQMNQYAVFLDKPGYFEEDLARHRRVKGADIQRVANDYLTEKRLVVSVEPRGPSTTTVEPAAAGFKQALASPSQQAAAGGQPDAAAPAGVRPQTKAEADATPPAGAAPTTISAPAAEKADKKGRSKRDQTANLPPPKPDPQFSLPAIERRRLTNGLEVLVVEQHGLPVVNMNLVLKTGAAAELKDRAGLASLTADMLDEGTRKLSALEISKALTAIGARLGTVVGWDASTVSLLALTRHLDRALEIYTDVIISPVFQEKELERLRNSRLGLLKQRRDNANAISEVALSALLYGDAHPYGRPLIGDEASVSAIGIDDIRRFYETNYHPNNGVLIVVGDVRADELAAKLERAFAGWEKGDVPAVNIAEPAPPERSTIYLIDRPGAPQSVITIGQPGVPRSTPDFFPLLVLNALLGGQFSSRVNLNLREDKGYTYGARTWFDYRRGVGPFVATAGVQTAVTKEAVVEFMKELRGVCGEIPVTSSELEFSKQAIIRGFPRGFETPEQVAGRLADIAVYELPDDYFNSFIARVRAVTLDDLTRVANRYLDPSRMDILVVGDRKAIESGLRALEAIGSTLTLLDSEGRPVTSV